MPQPAPQIPKAPAAEQRERKQLRNRGRPRAHCRSGPRRVRAIRGDLLRLRFPSMPLVELRNVSKIYKLGEEEIRALDDVSLDIEAGEFISIIGPSGSGKSTLLHILGCLDSPTKGTIQLDGGRVWKASSRQTPGIRHRQT